MTQYDEARFSRGIRLMFRHFPLLLFFGLVGGVIGIAFSYLFTPTFRAEALLIPSDETLGLNQNSMLGGLGGLASLVGVGGVGNKQSEALAVLKSRALTTAYIRANDLLPILFHDRWDSVGDKWKSQKPGQVPTLDDAYLMFDKSIRTIIENRKTGLVTVTVEWEDPKLAKEWADGIVEAANDLLRRQALARGTNNIAYLQDSLEKTSVMAVKDTLSKILESELKKQMMTSGNREYAFRVVDPPVVPEHKVSPKRSVFALFSAAICGLIGFFLVAFRSGRPAARPA